MLYSFHTMDPFTLLLTQYSLCIHSHNSLYLVFRTVKDYYSLGTLAVSIDSSVVTLPPSSPRKCKTYQTGMLRQRAVHNPTGVLPHIAK